MGFLSRAAGAVRDLTGLTSFGGYGDSYTSLGLGPEPVGVLIDEGPDEIVYQEVSGDRLGGLIVDNSGYLYSGRGASKFEAIATCLKVVTDTLLAIPLYTVDRNGERVETVFEDLQRRPNPFYRWPTILELLVSDYLLYGNAYLIIERNGNRPTAVWPISANRIDLRYDRAQKAAVFDAGGGFVMANFADDLPQVAHFLRKPIPDTLPPEGQSVLPELKDVIAHGMASDRFGVNTAHNGRQRYALVRKIRSGVSMPVSELNMTDEQQGDLRRNWNEATHGSQTWNKTPVLPPGVEPVPLSMSAVDMDLLNHIKLDRLRIAAAFQVPPARLNDLDKATYSNAAQQSREFVTNAVLPIINEFRNVFHSAILNGTTELRIEYDIDPVTRSEPGIMVDQKVKEIASRIRTPEQASKDMGYDDYDEAYWAEQEEKAKQGLVSVKEGDATDKEDGEDAEP